jgi:hypothetical protein
MLYTKNLGTITQPIAIDLKTGSTSNIIWGKIETKSIEGLDTYLIEWRREYFYKNFLRWIELPFS